MEWENLFDKQMKERGLELYKKHQLETVKTYGLKFKGYVRDAGRFLVTGEIKDTNDIKFTCTCPASHGDRKCAHMAALCYAVGEKDFFADYRVNSYLSKTKAPAKKATNNIIHPFERVPGDREYYFYDLAEITRKVMFREKPYAEAQKLLQEHKVGITKVEDIFTSRFTNERTRVLRVTGFVDDAFGKDNNLLIIISPEEVLFMESTYPKGTYCYDPYGYWFTDQPTPVANSYLTALFIELAAYIKKNNPGDYTNEAGTRFLKSFKSESMALVPVHNELAVTQNVQLEPRLERFVTSINLSFKIGTKKLFVLKHLDQFVKEVENEDTHALGTKAKLDFKTNKFTEEAAAYYRIIKDTVEDDAYKADVYNYNNDSNISYTRDNIPLYGRYLDSFFEIAKGKILELKTHYDNGTETEHVKLQDKDLKQTLVVSPDEGKNKIFRGIKVTGTLPSIYTGANYAYFVEDKCLNRTLLEKVKGILALAKEADEGKLDLRFGRKKMNIFYRNVLPKLEDSVQIVEEKPELIEQYLAPEVKFSFYLDCKDGQILCEAMAHYDEQQYNLLEVLSNQELNITRDKEKEKQVALLMQHYFEGVNIQEGIFVIINDDEKVWAFLDEGIKALMELGVVNSTEAFKRLKVRPRPKIEVGVSLESGVMDLSITSEDLSAEELLDILYSHKRKRKFYRLRNGDFLKVEDNTIEELAAMLEVMHVTPKEFVKGKMHIPSYRALYLDKMLEQNADVYSKRDSNFRKLIKEFKTINESDFEVPESLSKIMRNYQVQGYKWLRTLAYYGFGGILADDMGLGKTLQAISVMLAAKEAGETQPSLIVCPASLVYNWLEEFTRYAPDLKVLLLVGTQKERAEKLKQINAYDAVVTSYDLLKRDVVEYEGLSFNYQFLDEAQFIKTHSTAAAKSVKTIKALHKFALTGTPIENRLSELWSIFDYLMPGYLYDYSTFREYLENPIVKVGNEDASKRLKQMVTPFILRRLKKNVLQELPDKIEEVRMAQFEAAQQKLYDGQVVRTLRLVESQSEESFAKSKIEVLAELMRLRQICCDPGLSFSDYNGGSAKRELCLELVKSAIEGEHKVLIFSQFTSMLDLLAQDLTKENIAFYTLTGATPKEKRVEMVREFNQDNTPVFLISLKAGGTGLNLTGADVVIHYDPWWNVAAQNQATDRAHRIGQEKIVSVYKLIVKNSIEEKILRLQEDKQDLAESVLNGEGASSIFKMSKEDIMDLL